MLHLQLTAVVVGCVGSCAWFCSSKPQNWISARMCTTFLRPMLLAGRGKTHSLCKLLHRVVGHGMPLSALLALTQLCAQLPCPHTLDVNQNGIGGSLPASWGSASAFPELLNLVSLSAAGSILLGLSCDSLFDTPSASRIDMQGPDNPALPGGGLP